MLFLGHGGKHLGHGRPGRAVKEGKTWAARRVIAVWMGTSEFRGGPVTSGPESKMAFFGEEVLPVIESQPMIVEHQETCRDERNDQRAHQ
jgi:hypothetical protein